MQLNPVLSSDEKELKVQSLSQRLRGLTDYIELMEACCREVCQLAKQWTTEQSKQWTVELESGGNIKFTPGDPSLSWYKSCCDLVHSRFSVANKLDVVSVLSFIHCITLRCCSRELLLLALR